LRRLVAGIAISLALAGCDPGGPPEDATGEEIFAQLCARCHGADLGGRVGPDLGPDSNAATESDEFIEFTVVNGRGRMPSFSSLGEGQLDRLVAYIREVQDR
jgi:mono/diheme cytochrome c family protein